MEPIKYITCSVNKLREGSVVVVCNLNLKKESRVAFIEIPHKHTPFPFWEQYSNPLHGFRVKKLK